MIRLINKEYLKNNLNTFLCLVFVSGIFLGGCGSPARGTEYAAAVLDDGKTCSRYFLKEVQTLNEKTQQLDSKRAKDLAQKEALLKEFLIRFEGLECTHPQGTGKFDVDTQIEESLERVRNQRSALSS